MAVNYSRVAVSLQKNMFGWTLPTRRLLFHGTQHYCPTCESHIRDFLPVEGRAHAMCPVCRSMPRHRLLFIFLSQRTTLLEAEPKRFLHIAPEWVLEDRFRQMEQLDYISADLHSPKAMVRMDITDIHFPAETFDVICCSHVLEHVNDDRKAMREFYRVLRFGGAAILMVPMSGEPTVEDASIVDPNARTRLFGRFDHVRRYGPDFGDRLEEAGFHVSMVTASELTHERNLRYMGLKSEITLTYCEKRHDAQPWSSRSS